MRAPVFEFGVCNARGAHTWLSLRHEEIDESLVTLVHCRWCGVHDVRVVALRKESDPPVDYPATCHHRDGCESEPEESDSLCAFHADIEERRAEFRERSGYGGPDGMSRTLGDVIGYLPGLPSDILPVVPLAPEWGKALTYGMRSALSRRRL